MYVDGKIIDKASGIYCIENILNHKKYIGRTTKIGNRKRCHFSELNRGVSNEHHLQYSFNKYGKHAFVFYVIKYCPISDLQKEEQNWMDFFEVLNRNKGYNTRLADEYAPLTQIHKDRISKGNTGKIRTKEAREKDRNRQLGKKPSEETKKLMSISQTKRVKKIAQYTKDGKLVKIYSCQRVVFRENGWPETGQICDCCNGRAFSSHGFKWSYVNEGV